VGFRRIRLLDLKDATVRLALADAKGEDGIEQVFAQNGAVYS
jgi:hypothetical protein